MPRRSCSQGWRRGERRLAYKYKLQGTMENKGEIVIYQPDSEVRLEVRFEGETVWLTQAQMAELFGTTAQNISMHIGNVFKEGELESEATCKDFLQVRSEGSRRVKRLQKCYNLDVIISVGYRVKSIRGTRFRQWASKLIKEHLLRGYSVSQRFERLEQRVSKAEDKIDFFVRTALPPVEGVFYDGQIFDAFAFVSGLIRSARERIVLIDNYIDETVLLRLAERGRGVRAAVYTAGVSPSFGLALQKHEAQYGPVELRTFSRSHDRFLIIDASVYHLGASVKDLGRKWFAFSRLALAAEELLSRLEAG